VSEEAHALHAPDAAEVAAPVLDYRPPMPRRKDHRIALIGAGGIASAHLDAYRKAGFDVRVIASPTLAHAQQRRDAFFPAAEATTDIAATLLRPDIDVVDLTPHAAPRLPLIEAALLAGKHVLSQKPFVLDLDTGARLAALAEERGLMLAVNQNGRWAPYLSWMREAVRQGFLGEVQSVHIAIHWDHAWIAGTAFDQIEDLLLYDFAIHWLDVLASLIGPKAKAVRATRAHAAGQVPKPPLLSQVTVAFEGGQAALLFDGATKFGARDRTLITGTKGTLESTGPDLGRQQVTFANAAGIARPVLEGTWFNDGFAGTMGALLQAIETGVSPLHNARDNLDSLALAFAAIAASRSGDTIVPGSVRSLAEATKPGRSAGPR
jgi:predicted dehydrogenase